MSSPLVAIQRWLGKGYLTHIHPPRAGVYSYANRAIKFIVQGRKEPLILYTPTLSCSNSTPNQLAQGVLSFNFTITGSQVCTTNKAARRRSTDLAYVTFTERIYTQGVVDESHKNPAIGQSWKVLELLKINWKNTNIWHLNTIHFDNSLPYNKTTNFTLFQTTNIIPWYEGEQYRTWQYSNILYLIRMPLMSPEEFTNYHHTMDSWKKPGRTKDTFLPNGLPMEQLPLNYGRRDQRER